ncbi:type IV toxin-antitoxin system AbiEi family antitoxin domain-containing protein [Kribbella sp. NPDC005582]|uniref:type IV toxin-antitoxin system AbiEi family antitoxin domain-containing protein n=1 Tax=Kribbella sp. NPDC005582 TaxID=3156893 RepID=UPI00339F857A
MNPQLAVMACLRGGVFRRADARACGYDDADIDYLLASGGWRRIRRGTYAEQRAFEVVTEAALYLRRVHRVLRAGGGLVFASHQSAAALHALPVWGLDLSTVHVTATGGRRGRVGGVYRHIRDPVGPGVLIWNRLPMVSAARAVAEVAATAPTIPAIALADAALYAGLASKRTLRRAAGLLEYGGDRALGVFAHCRGSASVAESRLRFILEAGGLPEPAEVLPTGVEVPEREAALWFPEQRTLLEFELRHPYWCEEPDEDAEQPPPVPAADGPPPVETCWISWTDLDHPKAVLDRITSTFARAARRTDIRHVDFARM